MSDLGSARNSVDAVKGLNSDTHVKDTDFHGLKPHPKLERERTYGSWSLRASGRLTRTLSRQFALTLDDELYEEFAAEWGRRRGSSRRGRKVLAAAVLAALLAFLAGLAVRSVNRAAAPAAAGVPGTAAWHKGSRGHTADYYDLGAMYRMCGQAKLPAIQLPKQTAPAMAWQPDGVYPPSSMDALALNCSTLKDAAACNSVPAASNAYEGELLPLTAEDLAAHTTASHNTEGLPAADLWQQLSALQLDCEADPASCELAQRSNSYSYSTDGDSSAVAPGSAAYKAAAAEAAAYLYASQAPSGWDAIIGSAAKGPQQQQGEQQAPEAAAAADLTASNSYEESELLWVQRRISEEAGAQYMDAFELELDCSGEQQDVPTAQECERSRATNRYEAAAKAQEPIPQVGGIAIQLQRFPHGMRTVGYDVPADWTQYESDAAATATATAAAGDAAEEAVDAAASMKKHASGCSCGHGATHNHTAKQQQQQLSAAAQAVAAAKIGLSPERLQSLQQLLQDIAQQRRVVGYNVPALDQQQLFLEQFAMQQQQQQQSGASTAAAAAAATLVGVPPARSASRLQEDSRLYARKYFKSPCNNPEARQLFKNSKNHPLDRSYYKNPANAPLLVQEMPQQPPQEAKASATDAGLFTVPAAFAHALLSLLGPATAALMTAAAAAAGTWYVAAGGFGSSKRRHKRVAPLKEVQEEADEPGCSDSGSPSCMHPSPSNNLLVPAGGGSGDLPTPRGSSEQPRARLDSANEPGQMPASLPPSLISCASTVHETSFDAVGDAAEAAIAAERAGAGVRVSQLDDVPEGAMDSPRGEVRCDSPFHSVQK